MLSENDRVKFKEYFESEISRYYVLCFCDVPDNNHLLKNYGSVSLEISKNALLSLVNKAIRDSCITGYLNYRECEYNFESQGEIVKSIVTQWSDGNRTSVVVEDFSVLAVTFKDSVYREEKETRLTLKLRRDCPAELFGGCKCLGKEHYQLYLHGGLRKFIKSMHVRGPITPKERCELERLASVYNIESGLHCV